VPKLQTKELTAYYGPVKAIEKVSIEVGSSEIVALIGPNGAGKSTTLKAIVGLLHEYDGHIDSGDILLNNESIIGLRTDQLVRKGMALVPEGRRVFPSMTVYENLEMGAYIRKDKPEIKQDIDSMFEMFPRLKERRKQRAGTLSSGEQQMLALGRAMMSRPQMLLADEPSLGLSPNYVETIFGKLLEINRSGVSILLVEQNASMALEVSHRAYVFEVGKIALSDKSENLLENPQVKKAFLGA